MTLCISGQQDLNKLESWTRKFFSDIPNKKAPNPAEEYWGKIPPFLPQNEASLLEVVPVGESRRIALCWPLWVKNQAERNELLLAKPEQLVAHLIGHEGKGSIRSLLVAKGWGNSVQAAVTNDVTDMQMVRIRLLNSNLKRNIQMARRPISPSNLFSSLC
jgi:secreted Zn-dependent insulinase-like peptidase